MTLPKLLLSLVPGRPPELPMASGRVSVTPRLSCIIATTPRAGGGVLAEALAATGCMPLARRFFRPESVQARAARWGLHATGPAVLDDYLNEVLARTTSPDGVFAVTMHANHLDWLVRLLRVLTNEPDVPDDALVSAKLHAPRYVFVDRPDTSAQAVEWYLSARRRLRRPPARRLPAQRPPENRPPEKRPPEKRPPADFQTIRWLETILTQQRSRWADHIHLGSIEPLVVQRSDVVAQPALTATLVLASLGLERGKSGSVPSSAGSSSSVSSADPVDEELAAVLERYLHQRDALQDLVGSRRSLS